MAQAVEEWYKQMPIIPRSYLTAVVVTTVGCSLESGAGYATIPAVEACYQLLVLSENGKSKGGKLLTWRKFSLKELHSATNNFNYDNKLREGAFGSVYWGQLWDGSQAVPKVSWLRETHDPSSCATATADPFLLGGVVSLVMDIVDAADPSLAFNLDIVDAADSFLSVEVAIVYEMGAN